MDQIIEGDDYTVQVAFTDKDGNAVVPTSVVYRLDDVRSGTSLTGTADDPWVPIAVLASSIEIVTTATQNRIVGSRELEERRLTVKADYGLGGHKNADYSYLVKNLKYVS